MTLHRSLDLKSPVRYCEQCLSLVSECFTLICNHMFHPEAIILFVSTQSHFARGLWAVFISGLLLAAWLILKQSKHLNHYDQQTSGVIQCQTGTTDRPVLVGCRMCLEPV